MVQLYHFDLSIEVGSNGDDKIFDSCKTVISERRTINKNNKLYFLSEKKFFPERCILNGMHHTFSLFVQR